MLCRGFFSGCGGLSAFPAGGRMRACNAFCHGCGLRFLRAGFYSCGSCTAARLLTAFQRLVWARSVWFCYASSCGKHLCCSVLRLFPLVYWFRPAGSAGENRKHAALPLEKAFHSSAFAGWFVIAGSALRATAWFRLVVTLRFKRGSAWLLTLDEKRRLRSLDGLDMLALLAAHLRYVLHISIFLNLRWTWLLCGVPVLSAGSAAARRTAWAFLAPPRQAPRSCSSQALDIIALFLAPP